MGQCHEHHEGPQEPHTRLTATIGRVWQAIAPLVTFIFVYAGLMFMGLLAHMSQPGCP